MTTDYPEHEKLNAIADKSQEIGTFLEWLSDQGVHLMEWRTFTDPKVCDCTWNSGHEGTRRNARTNTWETCYKCEGTAMSLTETVQHEQWAQWHPTITTALAAYFEIDLDKIEQEKRAMLTAIRAG